jgi:hypothetical protein
MTRLPGAATGPAGPTHGYMLLESRLCRCHRPQSLARRGGG